MSPSSTQANSNCCRKLMLGATTRSTIYITTASTLTTAPGSLVPTDGGEVSGRVRRMSRTRGRLMVLEHQERTRAVMDAVNADAEGTRSRPPKSVHSDTDNEPYFAGQAILSCDLNDAAKSPTDNSLKV